MNLMNNCEKEHMNKKCDLFYKFPIKKYNIFYKK